ncbi:MAG: hypothetical protein AB1730_04135 [Myxococcota bacterium]
MVALLAIALLGAAPATIVSAGFSGTGVAPARLDAYAQRFAQQLSRGGGVKIVTPEDLGVDAQQALAGCAAGASCAAKLAEAQALMSGTVVSAGARLSAAVTLLDPVSQRALFSTAVNATDEKALLAGLDDAARRARGALGVGPKVADAPVADQVLPGVKAPPTMVSATVPLRETDWRPFTVMGAGLLAFGVSTYFFLQAADAQGQLDRIERDPALPGNAELLASARVQASRGKTGVTLGWTFAGVGAAAVAGGVSWLLLQDRSEVSAAVVPVEGGASAVLGGAW